MDVPAAKKFPQARDALRIPLPGSAPSTPVFRLRVTRLVRVLNPTAAVSSHSIAVFATENGFSALLRPSLCHFI
jgi:hypothetical protein